MDRVRAFGNLFGSAPGRIGMRAGGFALAVALERRRIARGPDRRRVRRVDARTDADPSLRQTIVLLAAPRAIHKLIQITTRGPDAKRQARQLELHRELRRLRAEHHDSPEALQEALAHLQQTHGPVGVSCLPALIRAALAVTVNNCPLPFLSQRRTLPDLLAGTRIVRHRRPRPRLGGCRHRVRR
ncbi:MAG TPA: hypothetical protein VMU32_06005 [Solirubrobacteraceae bacterium]|nr:hypothetical protein [Solirubrobacteraceae bacterium]